MMFSNLKKWVQNAVDSTMLADDGSLIFLDGEDRAAGSSSPAANTSRSASASTVPSRRVSAEEANRTSNSQHQQPPTTTTTTTTSTTTSRIIQSHQNQNQNQMSHNNNNNNKHKIDNNYRTANTTSSPSSNNINENGIKFNSTTTNVITSSAIRSNHHVMLPSSSSSSSSSARSNSLLVDNRSPYLSSCSAPSTHQQQQQQQKPSISVSSENLDVNYTVLKPSGANQRKATIAAFTFTNSSSLLLSAGSAATTTTPSSAATAAKSRSLSNANLPDAAADDCQLDLSYLSPEERAKIEAVMQRARVDDEHSAASVAAAAESEARAARSVSICGGVESAKMVPNMPSRISADMRSQPKPTPPPMLQSQPLEGPTSQHSTAGSTVGCQTAVNSNKSVASSPSLSSFSSIGSSSTSSSSNVIIVNMPPMMASSTTTTTTTSAAPGSAGIRASSPSNHAHQPLQLHSSSSGAAVVSVDPAAGSCQILISSESRAAPPTSRHETPHIDNVVSTPPASAVTGNNGAINEDTVCRSCSSALTRGAYKTCESCQRAMCEHCSILTSYSPSSSSPSSPRHSTSIHSTTTTSSSNSTMAKTSNLASLVCKGCSRREQQQHLTAASAEHVRSSHSATDLASNGGSGGRLGAVQPFRKGASVDYSARPRRDDQDDQDEDVGKLYELRMSSERIAEGTNYEVKSRELVGAVLSSSRQQVKQDQFKSARTFTDSSVEQQQRAASGAAGSTSSRKSSESDLTDKSAGGAKKSKRKLPLTPSDSEAHEEQHLLHASSTTLSHQPSPFSSSLSIGPPKSPASLAQALEAAATTGGGSSHSLRPVDNVSLTRRLEMRQKMSKHLTISASTTHSSSSTLLHKPAKLESVNDWLNKSFDQTKSMLSVIGPGHPASGLARLVGDDDDDGADLPAGRSPHQIFAQRQQRSNSIAHVRIVPDEPLVEINLSRQFYLKKQQQLVQQQAQQRSSLSCLPLDPKTISSLTDLSMSKTTTTATAATMTPPLRPPVDPGLARLSRGSRVEVEAGSSCDSIQKIFLFKDPKEMSGGGGGSGGSGPSSRRPSVAGLGLHISGCQRMSDLDRNTLAAVVTDIEPDGVVEQFAVGIQRGDEILEVNGVGLRNKSDEQIEEILDKSCQRHGGELELLVRRSSLSSTATNRSSPAKKTTDLDEDEIVGGEDVVVEEEEEDEEEEDKMSVAAKASQESFNPELVSNRSSHSMMSAQRGGELSSTQHSLSSLKQQQQHKTPKTLEEQQSICSSEFNEQSSVTSSSPILSEMSSSHHSSSNRRGGPAAARKPAVLDEVAEQQAPPTPPLPPVQRGGGNGGVQQQPQRGSPRHPVRPEPAVPHQPLARNPSYHNKQLARIENEIYGEGRGFREISIKRKGPTQPHRREMIMTDPAAIITLRNEYNVSRQREPMYGGSGSPTYAASTAPASSYYNTSNYSQEFIQPQSPLSRPLQPQQHQHHQHHQQVPQSAAFKSEQRSPSFNVLNQQTAKVAAAEARSVSSSSKDNLLLNPTKTDSPGSSSQVSRAASPIQGAVNLAQFRSASNRNLKEAAASNGDLAGLAGAKSAGANQTVQIKIDPAHQLGAESGGGGGSGEMRRAASSHSPAAGGWQMQPSSSNSRRGSRDRQDSEDAEFGLLAAPPASKAALRNSFSKIDDKHLLGLAEAPASQTKRFSLVDSTFDFSKRSYPTVSSVPPANSAPSSPKQLLLPELGDEPGIGGPNAKLGELQVQMSHNEEEQQIVVKILRARNLIAKDANGFSDPYVKVYLLPGREQENKRRTKHVAKTLNPEWNCTVVYPNVHKEEVKYKTLEFAVWDWDRFKSNDFIGMVKIDLSDSRYLDDRPRWFVLKENKEPDEVHEKEHIKKKHSQKHAKKGASAK